MSINQADDSSRIYLPGYEAQWNEDGAIHSQNKLKTSAKELSTAANLDGRKIFTVPCVEEETWNYRCSCTFQILHCQEGGGNSDYDGRLYYAMRSNKQAMKIGADYFPIATTRIQNVMRLVMKSFNKTSINGHYCHDHHDDNISIVSSFDLLKTNLSSVVFVSSWNQDMDCIVTFNYDKPIVDCESEETLLISQAEVLCTECNITALILRSKGKKIIVGWKDNSPPCIRDTIYISIPSYLNSNLAEINVSMDNLENDSNVIKKTVSIHYEKAHDAFQHPNHNAMLHALQWMVTKLRQISIDHKSLNNDYARKSLNLLEMYCGCGAHTMAIAKCGLFNSIVTVELDHRLVEACKKNAVLNCLTVESNIDSKIISHAQDEKGDDTPVYIFQGDAGEWSRKILKHRREISASLFNMDYHVLLLDPPRAGLDCSVCELAKIGSFEHIIYISCGREALKVDIKHLSDTFEVVDCTIIDLFPRTNSVESLVHFRRLKK